MIKQVPFHIFLITILLAVLAHAADTTKKLIFTSLYYASPQDFEQFVIQAQKAGATHIGISESLPRSFWQYDTPGDPYPAWTVTQLSILKIAPPAKLREFIPVAYSDKVMAMLADRCQVLRQHGLKAFIFITEPAMLPEAVYEKHPLWRGPIVSHPSRSTVTRFAPSTDNPEVQQLYREAMGILLKKCPEINIISMLTNDSGAGLDWSPGLYNGQIGNTHYASVTMEARIRAFFEALWAGAKDAGCAIDLNLGNTRERDPERIARTLSPGMAVNGLEGPDGRRFSSGAGIRYGGFFPVYGIPQVRDYLDGFVSLAQSNSARQIVTIDDNVHRDLIFALYRKVMAKPPRNEIEKLQLLAQFADERFGPGKANQYIDLVNSLERVADGFPLLNTGGYIFQLGCVHQRWLVRPFVPFPDELPAEVHSSYRRFQFQALADRINNLADVQATDAYYGWSGKHMVNRVITSMSRNVNLAIRLAAQLGDDDLARRLRVFECVMNNANGAVSYQAQLDRVRDMDIKPLQHAVIQTESGWDRQLMMATARREIDNTATLIELLGDKPGDYLRLAPTPAEEDISLLGPNIVDQLKRKLAVMNAHWEDYKRVFTTPNW